MEQEDIRILVDAHVFDGKFQGTRTFLDGIYKHLGKINRRFKIYLVANDIQNLQNEFSELEHLQFVKLKSKNKFIRLAYEIPKLIRNLKIDYAHFNYYLPLFLNKKCSYIVTIHDVLFLDYPQFFPGIYYYKNKFLFKIAARRAEILTTVSRYSAERLKTHYKLKKEVTVLPNALNEVFLKPLDKTISAMYIESNYGIKNYFIYVSRIEERKNHELLLKLYNDLDCASQGIKLVLIGSFDVKGGKVKKLFEEIKAKSSGSLYHYESIPWVDLKHFYNAARIAFFPSFCEGFGIPPLESAAMGTITLCADTTAMQDFCFFKTFLLNPTDIESWKKIVNYILEADFKRNMIIQSQVDDIQNYVQEHYQWFETSKVLENKILEYEIECQSTD